MSVSAAQTTPAGPVPGAYLDLLEELGAAGNRHSGRQLTDHLIATYKLLHRWDNPPAVCAAGLFHSIYGTDIYAPQTADFSRRQRIAAAIGAEAEQLAYLFCTTSRADLLAAAATTSPNLTNRLTGEPRPVTPATLAALLEIEVANFIEQNAQRGPGEGRRAARASQLLMQAGPVVSLAARTALQDFCAEVVRPAAAPNDVLPAKRGRWLKLFRRRQPTRRSTPFQ